MDLGIPYPEPSLGDNSQTRVLTPSSQRPERRGRHRRICKKGAFLTAVRTLKSSRLMYRSLATFTFPMLAPAQTRAPREDAKQLGNLAGFPRLPARARALYLWCLLTKTHAGLAMESAVFSDLITRSYGKMII